MNFNQKRGLGAEYKANWWKRSADIIYSLAGCNTIYY